MEEFPFTLNTAVRIADINYGGHVSNAAVLEYFQEARIAFFRFLGPYSEVDIGQGKGVILPEARVQYLHEMFHGDRLTVGVRPIDVTGTRFTLDYRVEREGVTVATGKTLMACFDYGRRKPTRLPDAFKHQLQSLC